MVVRLSNKITDITFNINYFNLKNTVFYSDRSNLKQTWPTSDYNI